VNLAKEYGISEQSVFDILKHSEYWLAKRQRKPDNSELEEVMSIWVEQAIKNELTLTGHLLQAKAKEFANKFEITGFNASDGEAGSMLLEDVLKFRLEFQDVLRNYEPRDIFNCDETALFWQLEPSKTLAYGPVLGKKKTKNRVTVMITCNSTGDEKLPLLFIHKYKTPRVLRGIEKSTLLVCQMRFAQRNIILLLDNASSHNSKNIQDLSNICIHFLPPNTTSCFQPIDQEIAYDTITEDNLVPPDITLYDAINFVAQAWKNVTSKTELEASASEEAELKAEIINLIKYLPIDDPLDVQEYIEIDNYMNIEEDLTINEIVDIVNGQNESESEKEQEEMVKIGDTIVGLDNLIKYV
ncbi:1717_t:CDS:2, partial [Racocetra persica]